MEMSTLLSTLPMDGHSPPAKIPLHQRLPPELLTTIFDNLFILESLRPEAVRLTCRAFRDAAWPPFARLFNNRVFHLTACSLDALLELSRQPRAVPYITHLDISTVRLHGNGIENLGVWMNSCESSHDRFHMKAQFEVLLIVTSGPRHRDGQGCHKVSKPSSMLRIEISPRYTIYTHITRPCPPYSTS